MAKRKSLNKEQVRTIIGIFSYLESNPEILERLGNITEDRMVELNAELKKWAMPQFRICYDCGYGEEDPAIWEGDYDDYYKKLGSLYDNDVVVYYTEQYNKELGCYENCWD